MTDREIPLERLTQEGPDGYRALISIAAAYATRADVARLGQNRSLIRTLEAQSELVSDYARKMERLPEIQAAFPFLQEA